MREKNGGNKEKRRSQKYLMYKIYIFRFSWVIRSRKFTLLEYDTLLSDLLTYTLL